MDIEKAKEAVLEFLKLKEVFVETYEEVYSILVPTPGLFKEFLEYLKVKDK